MVVPTGVGAGIGPSSEKPKDEVENKLTFPLVKTTTGLSIDGNNEFAALKLDVT
tara:strand:- start:45 stop:206 length:162 start_codon:yes stop_codon:yes gene_type:complete